MLAYKRTSEILQTSGLSLDHTYYLLCGSYADKYFIASMLHHLLEADPGGILLVSESDRDLVRIFIGNTFPSCLFVNPSTHASLVQACRDDPNSYMPAKQQGIKAARDMPRGCIRSLHIVDYPYFIALSSNRYARYIDLLRLIMGVPYDAAPRIPPFIDANDRQAAKDLAEQAGLHGKKTAIVNIVTFSHQNIPMRSYEQMEDILQSAGYAVAYNVAQCNQPEIDQFVASNSSRISFSIPGHLMVPVFDEASLAIGVIGGAMNIADSYSKSPTLILYRPANFFPAYDRHVVDPIVFEKFWPPARPKNKVFACHRIMTDLDCGDIPDLLSQFLKDLSNNAFTGETSS